MLVRHQNRRFDPRLFDVIDFHNVRHIGRIVHLNNFAVVHVQLVNDARRRRDQIEIEFARQAFGDDFEMKQAEEPATEPEPERR